MDLSRKGYQPVDYILPKNLPVAPSGHAHPDPFLCLLHLQMYKCVLFRNVICFCPCTFSLSHWRPLVTHRSCEEPHVHCLRGHMWPIRAGSKGCPARPLLSPPCLSPKGGRRFGEIDVSGKDFSVSSHHRPLPRKISVDEGEGKEEGEKRGVCGS